MSNSDDLSSKLKLPHETPLEAAEAYASIGWQVFPVKENSAPYTTNGFKDATDDIDQIRAWWRRWPHAGVAIATGQASGVWVLDIDVKDGKEGPDTLRAMRAAHDDDNPAPTVTVVTQSGGIHFYFNSDPDRPVTNSNAGILNFGEGVDVRGDGGYVVAPPSAGAETTPRRYQFTQSPWDIDPADAPDWLYNVLAMPAPAPEPTAPLPVDTDGAVTVDWQLTAPTVDDGSDAIKWMKENTDLGELLRRHGWKIDSHRSNGDVHYTRPGKDSGTSGVLHPSGVFHVFTTSIPAELFGLGTQKPDGVSFNAFDITAGYLHNGDRSAAARDIRRAYNAHHGITPTLAAPAPSTNGNGHHMPTTAPQGETEQAHRDRLKAEFVAKFITGDDIMNLPPPTPLVGTWVDVGAIVVMPAPFGSGKTHLTYDMALSVATGEPWLGQPIHNPGPAWLFIGEGAYTLRDRARGWLMRHPHHDQLPSNLSIFPAGFDLDRPDTWPGFRWYVEDMLADGIEPPRLIVFDTWSRYTSGGEIPEVTKPAMAAVEQIRDITGATILLPTHTGHSQTGRSRGDSTLEDNADIVMPVMAPLRDRHTGQIVPVKLTNTKQKARATQEPVWIVLEEVADPEPDDLEPNKTLAWVRLAGDDDLDENASQLDGVNLDLLHRLWTFIQRHDGKYTSREIERHEAAGVAALASQRDLKQAMAKLVAYGCVEHVEGGSVDVGKPFSRQPLRVVMSPMDIDDDRPKR